MLPDPVFYFLLVLLMLTGADAQDVGCYTSGSVAGIVIATIVVTLVMGGLAAAFIWYLWHQRKGEFEETKVPQKPMICPPMSPDKQLIAKENNDYAFDNPYFKDDEKSPDSAEKGESGFHLDNGDITQQNIKASNGEPKKSRAFSSLPFHSVFHPSSGKKQKTTIDDTYISKHLERITVPLRGHDFTGLGFNICGNMRDGIFVKDVLHRGPASESGKIKAGDKILGATVSFSGMVYEDALTILSYASPYDVRLELEKTPTTASTGTPPHLPSSSPKRLGTSTSFRTGGQRGLFHPLYRSQSIDDLTQIGKDNLLSGNSPGTQKTPKESSSTPKRSQSVETNSSTIKAKVSYSAKSSDEPARKSNASNKGSRTSSTSSSDSTNKVILSTTPNGNTLPEEVACVKKEVKSSRFRVEQINVKTEAAVLPPIKPARDPPEEKQTTEGAVTNEKPTDPPPKPVEEQLDVTDKAAEVNKPTVPPRTPKRRAPAPPPVTSAVVHRSDDEQHPTEKETEVTVKPEEEENETLPPPPPTSELPDFVPIERNTSELNLESSTNSSAVSVSHVPHQSEVKEEPSSPGKRKASSLGDLTRLEQGASHKASTSSAILERAVSLDLQQSIPGENLVKQKKVLKAPTFDSDCDENREDTEIAGLKRWEDQMLGLANGYLKHEEDGLSDSADQVDSGSTLTSVIENKAVTKKLITVDIDLDSSNSETTLQETLDSEKLLTSTPIRKVVEVKNYLKNDEETQDVVPPVEESVNGDVSSTTTSSSVFSPVTISIPIIKPDLTNFEKLPSPPPALDASWRVSKTSDDASKVGLERISVQSLYKPIFSSKEVPAVVDEAAETLVNGDDGGSESVKTPNNAAGFAKTLIIPGPNEVEKLLSLATEPNTPPPQLDLPPKPVE